MISHQVIEATYKHLKTSDRAYEFIFEIESVNDHMFRAENKTPLQVVEEYMSAENSRFLKQFLGLMNVTQMDEFILQLLEEIKKFSEFKLTLAFRPDEKFIDLLYTWSAQNLGSMYLLDITVDTEIIGGGIFVFNGKYKDMSLRKQLISYFENNNAVSELL